MNKNDIRKNKPYYDKKNKRYSLKVTVKEGEPRQTVYGKTKSEVYANAEKLLYKYDNVNYMIIHGIPFLELLKYNFNRRDKAGLIGDAQYDRTQGLFKRIEKSDIAYKNVKELKEEDYQNFFIELSQEYAQSSFDKFYCEINQGLEYAFRKKIIGEFPIDKKVKPRCSKPTKKIIALTIEQQKIFTEYIEKATIKDYPYKNSSLLQMYMGLRIGEANALSLEDFDLESQQVYVHKTVTFDRKGKTVIREHTKTEAGTRTLPIPDNILPYVKEQLEIAKTHKDNLLFVNERGSIVRESSSNSQLKTRLINLGIYQKDMATHALRHTYATRYIEASIDADMDADTTLAILSKLMGHSDISVTFKTYITIFDNIKAKSTKKVSAYYDKLNLFKNKVTINEEEQKISKNNQKSRSNILYFPTSKIVGNDWDER